MEWLEDEPPSPQLRRRRLLTVVALLVAVAVVVAISVWVTRSEPTDLADVPPGPDAPSTLSLPTRAPSPSTTTAPTTTNGFLRADDLDLFVRGDSAVYRIQTGAQRVTATPLGFDIGGPATTLVSGRRVMVFAYGNGGVWFTPGKAVTSYRAPLATVERVVPGAAGRLWVPVNEAYADRLRLVEVDGTPTSTVVDASGAYLRSDGRGGLLAVGVGGTYTATPDGFRRISRGAIVAVGPGHLLLTDCNASLRCQTYAYDVDREDLRPVGLRVANANDGGIVSPDGRYAVLQSWTADGKALLRAAEVATDRTIWRGTSTGDPSDGALEGSRWLSGDRLLGVREGKLFVLDLRTGRVTVANLGLPPLRQIAERLPA